MIFKHKKQKKVISGVTGALTGVVAAGLATKHITSKLKYKANSKKESYNKEINIIFDNSRLKKFVQDTISQIEKEYENLDYEPFLREIIRPLYTNEVENINLLAEINIRPAKKGFVKLNSFTSLFALSFFTLLFAIISVAFFLDKDLIINFLKFEFIGKISILFCFIFAFITFVVLMVKTMMLKNIKPEVVVETDIPLDVLNRKFGVNSQELLLKLKKESKSLCESLDNGVQIADDKLVKDVSRLYCDIYQALVISSQNNIKNDVFPTFKQVLSNDLKLLVIENYDEKTKKYFDLQIVESGLSRVLQPAILAIDGKIIMRGRYLLRGSNKI